MDKFKLICSCSGGGSEYEFKTTKLTHTMKNLAPETEYNVTMWSATDDGKQSRREVLRFKEGGLFFDLKPTNVPIKPNN